MKLTLAHKATPSADVLFQEVGGEAVLLNLASESYFGLDPVGTRIWQLLHADPSLQRVFETMLNEYDITPAQLEADLLALVDQLSAARLVQAA